MNDKYSFKGFIHYFFDRNRTAFSLVIAFGLLMALISISFMLGMKIGESNRLVSLIELLVAFTLVGFGFERINAYNKLKKEHEDITGETTPIHHSHLNTSKKEWIILAVSLTFGFIGGIVTMLIKT